MCTLRHPQLRSVKLRLLVTWLKNLTGHFAHVGPSNIFADKPIWIETLFSGFTICSCAAHIFRKSKIASPRLVIMHPSNYAFAAQKYKWLLSHTTLINFSTVPFKNSTSSSTLKCFNVFAFLISLRLVGWVSWTHTELSSFYTSSWHYRLSYQASCFIWIFLKILISYVAKRLEFRDAMQSCS